MIIFVPSIVAANGNKITFEGLRTSSNVAALIALNHTSYVDWVPRRRYHRGALRFRSRRDARRTGGQLRDHMPSHPGGSQWGRCTRCSAAAGPGNSLLAPIISRSLELREFKIERPDGAEAQVPIIL